MEKKPNITPTPWTVMKHYEGDDNAVIKCAKETIGDIYSHLPVSHKDYIEHTNINAQAIVTAVNCTYGANLNPEKIQQLIDSMDALLLQDELNEDAKHKAERRAIQALNNIKYKE